MSSLGSTKLGMSYLVRRSAPGSQSQSSRIHSGSSLLCRRRCFDRGCSSTVWEAPWSRRAWHRLPSGSRRGGGRPYSVHRWTDPECSPHSRSWVTLSTPRWGTPALACSLVDLQGRDCHLSPGSHFLQEPCKQYAECWWKWCLKIKQTGAVFTAVYLTVWFPPPALHLLSRQRSAYSAYHIYKSSYWSSFWLPLCDL